MCRFFSGVQTKDRGVLFDMWDDSYETVIKNNKLYDTKNPPEFVRLELVPKKEEWNKDIANWELHVDQDIRPDWFSEKFAKQEMWEALQKLWKEMLIEGQEIDEIKNRNVRWLVNSKVNKLLDSSTVKEMGGSSTVNRMGGSSMVKEMANNSIAHNFKGVNPIVLVANKKIKVKVHKPVKK